MLPLILLSIILGLFYLYWTKNYNHWEKKKLPHVQANFPFGNIKKLIFGKQNILLFLDDLYRTFESARVVGFYAFRQPMLMIKDLDLVKDIIIKDFSTFADNGFITSKEVDPNFALSPFGSTGELWKRMRNMQTPAHTISKVKLMIPLMAKTAQNFVNYVSEEKGPLNVGKLSKYYTTDTVSYCGYSTESDSFHSRTPFSEDTIGELFEPGNAGPLSSFFAPWAAKIFKCKTISKAFDQYFIEFGKTIIEQRKASGTYRNDLVQHLIEQEEKLVKQGNPPLPDEERAVQLTTFFLDGTETAALALSFCLFEIAAYPDVQEKLRNEIKSASTSVDDFDYDKLWSLEYLNMVISETLRRHPPVPFLSRVCVQDYENDGVTIDKGTKVFIPTYSIHHDPKYYPEPDVFDPERFSKETRENANKFTFMPFGEGPRICIGKRFALTQIKMAIVALLLKYRLTLSPVHKTKRIEMDDGSVFIYFSKNDLLVIFEALK